jgi:copper chaperone CopZ
MFVALLSVLVLGLACSKSNEPRKSIGKTSVATFAITDMVTPNCPVLVKTALGKMDGIKRVEADVESKTATVEYYEAVTDPEAILEVIKEQAGFNATIVGS